VTNVYLLLMCN